MSYQSEAQLEEQLISQLENQEYERIKIDNDDDLIANFKKQFEIFNSSKIETSLSDKEWERIFNHMLGRSVYDSGMVLRDKFVLERDDGSKVYLSFLDEDHTKNHYQVTHQVTQIGKYTNRYDVTLLVNGLPLIHIELKRRGMDLREAINQIMRYKKHSLTGLYRYVQIFVVSNGVDTKYFSNTDKELMYSLTFYWTDEQNMRINNLRDFAVTFLARDHIIRMMTQYTIMNSVDKVMMVMRPYQVYAVQALVRQARLTDRNAYIWHTTGAGKTLTAFKTAQILSSDHNIKKVVFLVDRRDLDSQTFEEFNKFEEGSVDVTDNTAVLVKQMKDKNCSLIITTIQKMSNAVNNSQYSKVMDQYKNEKVIFIVDECHRSQFGDMHKKIVRHFNKAQFFGFTGTPRFEVNGKVEGKITQTTKMLFGECLHTYLIKNAIYDNNVLGFHVEYINTIKGAFDEADESRVQDIDTAELYESDQRMNMVANHIILNHKAKTRNKQYTAIFAVSSIPMLIKYYDIFKNTDHDLNVGAIFSYGANEDGEGKKEHSRDSLERIIGDYNEMFNTNWSTDTFHAYHRDISDRVKGKKAKPLDILLVVNMFLTGFDSKPLSVLYVDKELKYHDLLQAYSRTNRVEKETKPYGIIVCYRNLKKATDDALTLFSMEDNTDGILIPEFDYFIEKYNEAVARLKMIAPTPDSVDMIMDENIQKEFVELFKELTKLLQSLQTFVEYPFSRDKLDMTDQEFLDYRSKYFDLYHRHKMQKEKASVLDDVDFCIELMESNRINVAYIMNLIRNIDFSDRKTKMKDIDNIRTELDRADNEELHKKVDLIRAFLDHLESGFTGDVDIDMEYSEFENVARSREIREFAKEEDFNEQTLNNFIAEYEFSGILNEGRIRDSIEKPMPLLKKKSLTKRIAAFIVHLADKYM